jgi:cytosine/adenosine deaminase-related metal-dependent hydrolase
MFGLMRTALGTQRGLDNAAMEAAGLSLAGGEPIKLTCRDIIEFATIEGARACGLDSKVGSLTPGKEADIILVRTDVLGMAPVNNATGAIVYNAHPGLVDTVLVAGRVVKRDGEMVDVDVKRAMRLGQETRDHVLEQAAGDELINDVVLHGHWTPRSPVHAH